MPHRPSRASRRRIVAARALALAAMPVVLGACGRSLLPGRSGRLSASERRGVLACAAEVGAAHGLTAVAPIASDGDRSTLRLAPGDGSTDPAALRAALAGTGPTRDELVVGFGDERPDATEGRLRHALRVAVRSFRLTAEREGRGDAPGTAARAEWRPTPPSPHGAELRDLVLARCGTLGR